MPVKSMNIIVAMIDASQGIGINGTIPWHLPREFKYFVQQTSTTRDACKHNAVLMGRRVWESIPKKYRPLPHRLNIVLSRQPSSIPDVIQCNSFEKAVELLSDNDEIETIWNIGGREVYERGLQSPILDRIYITRIYEPHFDTDVVFPDVDWSLFREIQPEEEAYRGEQIENGIRYRYCIYERIK